MFVLLPLWVMWATEERPRATRPSAARERLLDTAGRLFYAEGIRGVGVERVLAEANVTRSTFYNHFPGKEDLVVAYLQAAHERDRALMATVTAPDLDPRARLTLLVTNAVQRMLHEGHRGCPFTNAAVEFPDPTSRIHQVVLAYRAWFLELAADVFAAARHPDPEHAARGLLMLRDGAATAGYLEDAEATREHYLRAAEAVIAS
jgi:AcrR family transcriptional regulator